MDRAWPELFTAGADAAAGAEVGCLGMVDDDRGRRLLRDELVRRGELDAELGRRREQPQHQLVLLEVGAGGVAPRVAAAAARFEPELGQDAAVDVLGEALGGLDREAVREVGLAVLARRLER